MNRLLKIAVLLVMVALTAGAPALLLAADATPADKAAAADKPAADAKAAAKAPTGPGLLILAGAAFGAGLVTLGAGIGIGLIGSRAMLVTAAMIEGVALLAIVVCLINLFV